MPKKLVVETLGWKRDQGEFDPGPKGEDHQITLAQAKTPESIRERLNIASVYCGLAEEWIKGTKVGCKSEEVAKSFLRDAIVRLAEVWLGKSADDTLAFVRDLMAKEEDLLARRNVQG